MSEQRKAKLNGHSNEEAFENSRLAFFATQGRPVTARRVEDRQDRTLYLMETAGSGDPVLLVHGGGSEASEWATLLPHLSSQGRHLVVDRPGHGLSYKLDYTGVPYRQAAVEYLVDLLGGLGIERASFVANSMGGFFSLCFALAHPERVNRLVLVGAPAGVDRWIPPFLRLMGLRGPNRLLFRQMRNPTPAMMREKVLGPLLVADPNRVSDEELSIRIASQSLPGAETSWRTLLESVVGLGGFQKRYMIRDEVASLGVPTTFIWGERDAFAPPSSGQDLASRMPNAKLVAIEGAGHMPWIDAPEACATAIEAALDVERPAVLR